VPLLNASLTDCVFEVKRKTSKEEVNELLQAAAEGPLQGILGYETRPLVSADYTNDPRSSIVDALSTMVVDDTLREGARLVRQRMGLRETGSWS